MKTILLFSVLLSALMAPVAASGFEPPTDAAAIEETSAEPRSAALPEVEPGFADLAAAFGPDGFQGIAWGQKAADAAGLRYAVTDPANGLDVYLLDDAAAVVSGEKEERVQYFFRDNRFFRVHIPVSDKKTWQTLESALMGRYGSGYHLAGPKDVYQWETDDLIVILRFDEATGTGYLEAESRDPVFQSSTKDSAGMQTLLKALQNKDAAARVRAVTDLGLLKDERATMPLVSLLRDDNFIVRYNAAAALGEIKDPRAVLPLIKALEDDDGLVRSFAADALALIGDKRAVEALIRHVRDNRSAVDALEKLTGNRLGRDASAWQQWWQATGSAAGQSTSL